MTAQLIDGKAYAATIRTQLKKHIKEKVAAGRDAPHLAVILMGNDEASKIYVKNKQEACLEVGIKSSFYPLEEHTTQQKLLDLITTLNSDEKINGILIQLPLPQQIDLDEVLNHVKPEKDVDGFHPLHLGKLVQKNPTIRACTPYGIVLLLQNLKIQLRGMHAVLVGASNIVGKPLALELLQLGCTVSICHKYTENLFHYVKQADLLVSAVGKPSLIPGEWIKKDCVVIDVGINRLADGKISGDVQFEDAKKNASWITPVPGGVGPMTVAALLLNTYYCCYGEKLV